MLPTPTRPQIYVFFSVCGLVLSLRNRSSQKKKKNSLHVNSKQSNHKTTSRICCHYYVIYQLFKTTGPTMFPMRGTHLLKPPHLPLLVISSSVRCIKHTVFDAVMREAPRRDENKVRTRRNFGVKWRNCECEKNLEVCGHVSERIGRSKLW